MHGSHFLKSCHWRFWWRSSCQQCARLIVAPLSTATSWLRNRTKSVTLLLVYKKKLSIPKPLCLFAKGISVNAFGIHLGGEKIRLYMTPKVGFFEVVTPLGDARCFICASETFLLVFWLSRLCFLTDFVDQKFYGLTKLCSFRWYAV